MVTQIIVGNPYAYAGGGGGGGEYRRGARAGLFPGGRPLAPREAWDAAPLSEGESQAKAEGTGKGEGGCS